ncbi:MAG: aldose epimerase family protein [bacterium]
MRGGSQLRSVERAPFGLTPDGARVDSFVLRNASGMEVSCLNLGGIIRSICVPDRHGVMADVTPGYDSLEDYLHDPRYFGALVGRVANRIANARFTLDGRNYQLPANEGVNHLHGGPGGFHRALWHARPFADHCGQGVVLTHTSAVGEQGYPGTLDVRVTYSLTEANELCLEYEATTDAATPVNVTQHTYFNLAGHNAGSAMEHELLLAASRFTPVDSRLIPTGDLQSVRGTPFDFTTARPVGAVIDTPDDQLRLGNGYDHNWVLDAGAAMVAGVAARLHEPRSGRTMEVETTEPGIQFYSGNGITGGPVGKGGAVYSARCAVALETQHFPDAPNQPAFPPIIVRPGAPYRSRTVYRFGVA